MGDKQQIDNILEPLVLTDDKLKEIKKRMLNAMEKGLNPATSSKSSLKMLPTYVRNLPTGKEKGDFLALDLGGTNFRVLLISLDGDNSSGGKMESKIYAVDKHIMLGPGEELFDYLAECLKSFIEWQNLGARTLPLGFTFSFPCTQEALTEAHLIRWTKGFSSSGVVGKNVIKLLEDALIRKEVKNIAVTALVNDTTGTLMSCAYQSPTCQIGLILGTGTNACYVERLDKVLTWKGDRNPPNQVLINMEWGAFGDKNELDFILTEFDKEIDNKSLNRTEQLFEKLISGMYLGEIARIVLLKLVESGLLFNGVSSETLREPYEFPTKYISEIEIDDDGTFAKTREILREIGIEAASNKDCSLIRRVCELVTQRAAYLSAAGVSAVLEKIGKPFITIGVDGSVYRHHPHFHDLLVSKISQLVDGGRGFEFVLSHDGSGRGAALVAAVASKALHV